MSKYVSGHLPPPHTELDPRAMQTGEPERTADERPEFELIASREFGSWLAQQQVSIAFSTYQAGKLFLIGLQPDGSLSVFERTFPRCMGLHATKDGRTLLVASDYQIFRLDNAMRPGQAGAGGIDATYVPNASWITGDLDIHDVALRPDGDPLFVATRFNCIGQARRGYSFAATWRPPFVSTLAAEDRCHLNGMAVVDGTPRYATAVSRSDVVDGWRDRRIDGGVLMDIPSGEVLCDQLSMPHSPRVHGDKVWLLNSGTGELGFTSPGTSRFEPIAFMPGFARGLDFVGRFAVVGLSLPREARTFTGLPIDERLRQRDAEPRCGLMVVDTLTGESVAWMRIEGIVRELYDVAILHGLRQPSAIGFRTDEIRRVISIAD